MRIFANLRTCNLCKIRHWPGNIRCTNRLIGTKCACSLSPRIPTTFFINPVCENGGAIRQFDNRGRCVHLKLTVDFQSRQNIDFFNIPLTPNFWTGLEGSRPAEFESAIRFEIGSTGQKLSPLEMSKKYCREYMTILQKVAAPTFFTRIHCQGMFCNR